MPAAYYQDHVYNFLKTAPEEILGTLTLNHGFALEPDQTNAWHEQIVNLQVQLVDISFGTIFFEFSIPRMGKRADVVLFIKGLVFVLEYKTGSKKHERYAADQCLDYALDLKNFHAGSHNSHIIPILISTRADPVTNTLAWFQDNICRPLMSNGRDLGAIIKQSFSSFHERKERENVLYGLSEASQETLDSDEWSESGYKPTPTIIEAAQALYQKHAVEEISRSDAGVKNLTQTTDCINSIIRHSRTNNRKSICFITGVPGAGKTLAGLNISTQTLDDTTKEHAVFLSGNGPLVAVLREALARDKVARAKQKNIATSKKDALREVSAFIQNVHHFRDWGLKFNTPPNEHVVVFDEAQRAWNQEQAESFMIRKKGLTSFDKSEPEFLISLMDRRTDWCTIICLIGGGQEINTGEAGLIEWFHALQKSFKHWDIYHSGQLTNKDYHWGEDLNEKLQHLNAVKKEDLHLNVSMRSFRAEKLSEFVGAVIDADIDKARNSYSFLEKYHLGVTRDINSARSWLRQRARGSERLGLVASSGAIRLKPEGITVKAKIDPVTWFLNGKEDIRSSYYLEDVATEFDMQGLELDWAGVCWDADFRMQGGSWRLYDFKGTKWQNVNDSFRRVYLANAYRVLLTRARQGMIIFVPKGDKNDPTRPPEFYDETYEFLKKCKIPEV